MQLKPIFHLAALFAGREAKTRIRQRDWVTLVGEKIHCEQVGTVPTFFSVRTNQFAEWKTGLSEATKFVMSYIGPSETLRILNFLAPTRQQFNCPTLGSLTSPREKKIKIFIAQGVS